jgi:hypothetical protein
MRDNKVLRDSALETARNGNSSTIEKADNPQVVTVSKPKTPSKIQQIAAEAARLAKLIEEPNVSSVQRLIEIFGVRFVTTKLEEALRLHAEAAANGEVAYQEPATPVATSKSKPRTRGGVFFYLMREHCFNLGLDWNGLKISPPSWHEQKARKQSSKLTADTTQATQVNNDTSPVNTLEHPQGVQPTHTLQKRVSELPSQPEVQNHNAASGEASANVSRDTFKGKAALDNVSKPTHIKATIVGSILGSPKINPQGMEGLLELQFKAEMNNSLPKGLPNLGHSKVTVWCTKKQFDKVSQQTPITSLTRFIIEGEPVPAVSADFTPFLRIICTRLTTVELEQSRRAE